MKEIQNRLTLNIPLTAVESLFTVLHNLKATQYTRLEMKAVQILKSEIYFELEKLMETEEEAEARKQILERFLTMRENAGSKSERNYLREPRQNINTTHIKSLVIRQRPRHEKKAEAQTPAFLY
jgi:tRNA A37 threonylcarbamoyladenosine modification protein TsaB